MSESIFHFWIPQIIHKVLKFVLLMILEDGASKHSTGDWPGPSCGMVTCQRTSHEEIDNKHADPASPAGRWRRPYSWFTWIKYQPLLSARTWSSNPTTDLWVQNYHEVQFTDEIHGTESDLDLSGQTLGFQLPNDFCPSLSSANSACRCIWLNGSHGNS